MAWVGAAVVNQCGIEAFHAAGDGRVHEGPDRRDHLRVQRGRVRVVPLGIVALNCPGMVVVTRVATGAATLVFSVAGCAAYQVGTALFHCGGDRRPDQGGQGGGDFTVQRGPMRGGPRLAPTWRTRPGWWCPPGRPAGWRRWSAPTTGPC